MPYHAQVLQDLLLLLPPLGEAAGGCAEEHAPSARPGRGDASRLPRKEPNLRRLSQDGRQAGVGRSNAGKAMV